EPFGMGRSFVFMLPGPRVRPEPTHSPWATDLYGYPIHWMPASAEFPQSFLCTSPCTPHFVRKMIGFQCPEILGQIPSFSICRLADRPRSRYAGRIVVNPQCGSGACTAR